MQYSGMPYGELGPVAKISQRVYNHQTGSPHLRDMVVGSQLDATLTGEWKTEEGWTFICGTTGQIQDSEQR
jgi:hypothetical protein